MPIDMKQYHPNFPKRSKTCIKRAKYTCQYCLLRRGEEYITKSGRVAKVKIQAHHPNHDPMNGRATLVALCEQCHLEADKWYRSNRVRRTIYRKQREAQINAGQLELPLRLPRRKMKVAV